MCLVTSPLLIYLCVRINRQSFYPLMLSQRMLAHCTGSCKNSEIFHFLSAKEERIFFNDFDNSKEKEEMIMESA